MNRKPNRRVIRRWVNALRSGKYKQVKYNLRTKEGFCCLGVLCDLYIRSKAGKKAGAKWRKVSYDNDSFVIVNAGSSWDPNGSEEGDLLPIKVAEWAGLEDADPRLGKSSERASSLNDARKYSFRRLANLIEKKYLS